MLNILNSTNKEVKRSKFINFYLEVDNVDEFDAYIKKLWLEHKKASHICYAYKIIENGREHIKANDDGEPRGSAGIPILRIINFNNLVNQAIVVVRYFGGTELGKGPLTRTYSKCASEIIKLDQTK